MIAGKHIIIECEGEHAHLSEEKLESTLSSAAKAAGATVLSSHFHRFGPQQGITGVLVLAESHITVHTWPEHNYAAFDVFMCGDCDPDKAAEVIIAAASSTQVTTNSIIRGIANDKCETFSPNTNFGLPKYLQATENNDNNLSKQEQL